MQNRHRRLTDDDSRKRLQQKNAIRSNRLTYSLFKKDINTGRYVQVSTQAYPERLAYKIFIARLSAAPLTYSIRPAKLPPDFAQGISKYPAIRFNDWKYDRPNWEY